MGMQANAREDMSISQTKSNEITRLIITANHLKALIVHVKDSLQVILVILSLWLTK